MTLENESLKAKREEISKENRRLNDERGDKDHLMTELTSKNIEMIAKLATYECTLKPLKDDLLMQLNEMRTRLEKAEMSNKELNLNLSDIQLLESRIGA